MEENIYVEDDSNDRKYFSLFPHFVLNHSTAIDQSLYIQMKRYAGEQRDGLCWASKRTLMKKMRIGKKSLNKSIEYLLSRGWIDEKGTKKVMTKGGEQEVTIYSIKDIWKQNIEFYQGGSERAYPDQGGSERTHKVGLKERKGGSERAPNKNHIKQEPYITRSSEQSSQAFNTFWEEYPNKKDKKKSLILWNKLKPSKETIEKIMSSLKQQKKSKSWEEDNGKFIPHPSTWLNGERWTDVVKTKSALTSKYEIYDRN